MPVRTRIQVRRDTAANWLSAPSKLGRGILHQGEIGYETDTFRLKVGDGTTEWASLDYLTAGSGSGIAGSGVTNYVPVFTSPYELGNSLLSQTSTKLTVDGDLEILGGIYDNTSSLGNSGQILSSDGSSLVWIDSTGGGSITGDLDSINFNTAIADPDLTQGKMSWNSEAGTIEIGLTDDLKIALGQSVLFRIKNSTGSNLVKGQAVYASGVLGGGQIIQVAKFVADDSIDEVRFIGLMTDDLANGEDGYVNNFGHIKNVDLRTSNTALNPNGETWAAGDILYVDGSTAGGLTKTAPQDDIYVAMVLADGQNGELFVRITDPGHIDDLHDVNTTGLADNNFLVWNSGSSEWEPSTNLTFDGSLLDIAGSGNFSSGLTVGGHLSAVSKSFDIPHPSPSKQGSRLVYGSLESPYHGVRLTGRASLVGNECVINLPDYIKDLVIEEDYSVQITNYKHSEILFVDDVDISKNSITIKVGKASEKPLEFFWSFTAVRKDIPKLVVET